VVAVKNVAQEVVTLKEHLFSMIFCVQSNINGAN